MTGTPWNDPRLHRRHPSAHTLMPLVTAPDRLKRAARACMRHPAAPGADGLTWAQYRRDLDARIAALSARLRDRTWRPAPIRQVAKPSWGKTLALSIPTVEDRIVHRTIRHALEPVLCRDAYPPWMYGWRPRAGRVQAIDAAHRHLTAGRTWVADLDVTAVTSGTGLDEVIDWVARWVSDGAFLDLTRRVLAGLPTPMAPGSGLSPLLTNLRLVFVDEQLHDLPIVRLTDNYTAFSTTRSAADAAMDRITAALTNQGMEPHPGKSKVWRPNPEDLYIAG